MRIVTGTRWARPAVLAGVVCVLLAVSGGEWPVVAVAGAVIAAVGLMFVTTAGGFDLSIGAVAVLCGTVAGHLTPLGVPVAITLGVFCGLVNGLLVTRRHWPPFLVTFGMLAAAGVVTTWLPPDRSVAPAPVVACAVALAMAVGAYVMLAQTVWGFRVSFVGSNDTAAEHAGVMVARLRLWTYALSGGLAAAAGVTAAPTGSGLQLEVVAIGAVLLGGTTPTGGRGTVLGTVLGAVAVEMLLIMLTSTLGR
jgi:ribose/xylose/arabinose/galactoside ABC-type transport system permease subunit